MSQTEHLWLKTDSMVELQAEEHGFYGAWFLVKIIRLTYHPSNTIAKVYVQYANFFKTEDSSQRLVEVVKPSMLRPLCPHREEDTLEETFVQRRRHVGDAVEAQHNGAWWEGTIKRVIYGKNEYLVSFNYGYEDLQLPAHEIRTRWDYTQMGEIGQWKWVKA